MMFSQTTIGLNHYLVLAAILFAIGAGGVIANRKNIISMLMSIELMLLAANVNFVAFSAFGAGIAGRCSL